MAIIWFSSCHPHPHYPKIKITPRKIIFLKDHHLPLQRWWHNVFRLHLQEPASPKRTNSASRQRHMPGGAITCHGCTRRNERRMDALRCWYGHFVKLERIEARKGALCNFTGFGEIFQRSLAVPLQSEKQRKLDIYSLFYNQILYYEVIFRLHYVPDCFICSPFCSKGSHFSYCTFMNSFLLQ